MMTVIGQIEKKPCPARGRAVTGPAAIDTPGFETKYGIFCYVRPRQRIPKRCDFFGHEEMHDEGKL